MAGTTRDPDFATRADTGQEWRYVRHHTERTLLYQQVEQYYPAFVEQLARQGQSLPDYVHREFDAYLRCGRLKYGFLACAASPAMPSGWWPSAARSVAFARAAAPGG